MITDKNQMILTAARNAGYPVELRNIRELQYVARTDGPNFDPFNSFEDAWRLVQSHRPGVTIEKVGGTIHCIAYSDDGKAHTHARSNAVQALCDAITMSFYNLDTDPDPA